MTKKFDAEKFEAGQLAKNANGEICQFIYKGEKVYLVKVIRNALSSSTHEYSVNIDYCHQYWQMVQEKKEGWVIVYSFNNAPYVGGEIFSTKEKAKEKSETFKGCSIVDVVKLTWEM